MKLKALLAFVLPVLFLISCEETKDQEVNIYLKNQTGSRLEVALTPTNAYLGMGGYRFSSDGNGYQSSSFQVDTGASYQIFSNAQLSETASEVTRMVFDKIFIRLQDVDKTILIFTPDSVVRYKSNIFSEDAVWSFKKNFNVRPTQFKDNPVECYDYYFVIDKENIIGKI